MVVAVAGPLLVAVLTGGFAIAMFLSSHDVEVVLVLLAAGVMAALLVAVLLTRPLVRDLRRIEATIARVADGDLDARVGLRGADDVGRIAAALDDLVARRQAAETERTVVLASISHDLRTPLTALRVALESVRDGVSPDPDRYLASMQRDLDAVDDLVDDLFLLGRLESGRYETVREPVSLSELIDDAVEALGPLARRNDVEIRWSPTGPFQVAGNASGLSRVVRNLLDNGIRHAPPGSAVAVDVRGDAGSVVVRVLDEGPGFPEPFREQAFERFTRADESRSRRTGSAGLGLAIARGVVQAHGGRIWAEPGPGGEVAFSLPR